ncbi:hypothetical protein B9Z65_1816 [Elsinoe australis]|uniref:Uncharacterized protein n=1 Tax=Elsinoe australis TaxID=40998 RepID=A0A2P7YKZ6_9PEZI|nr:hypothetical protein B9Z65_1816 [Elsinoe australis]
MRAERSHKPDPKTWTIAPGCPDPCDLNDFIKHIWAPLGPRKYPPPKDLTLNIPDAFDLTKASNVKAITDVIEAVEYEAYDSNGQVVRTREGRILRHWLTGQINPSNVMTGLKAGADKDKYFDLMGKVGNVFYEAQKALGPNMPDSSKKIFTMAETSGLAVQDVRRSEYDYWKTADKYNIGPTWLVYQYMDVRGNSGLIPPWPALDSMATLLAHIEYGEDVNKDLNDLDERYRKDSAGKAHAGMLDQVGVSLKGMTCGK